MIAKEFLAWSFCRARVGRHGSVANPFTKCVSANFFLKIANV